MSGEFSVCQYFADGTFEYVRRFVDIEEAATAAKHLRQKAGRNYSTRTM